VAVLQFARETKNIVVAWKGSRMRAWGCIENASLVLAINTIVAKAIEIQEVHRSLNVIRLGVQKSSVFLVYFTGKQAMLNCFTEF